MTGGSRKHRKGFWVIENCVICNDEFKLFQYSNKKRNRRAYCYTSKCRDAWAKLKRRQYRLKYDRKKGKGRQHEIRELTHDKIRLAIRRHELHRRRVEKRAKTWYITNAFLNSNNKNVSIIFMPTDITAITYRPARKNAKTKTLKISRIEKPDYSKENYCCVCCKRRPRPANFCPDCNHLVRHKPKLSSRIRNNTIRNIRIDKLRY